MTVADAPAVSWAARAAAKVSLSIRGASPQSTRTLPPLYASKKPAACMTAWPVPSRSRCSTVRTAKGRSPPSAKGRPAVWAPTISPPWPTTTHTSSTVPAAASMTQSTMGLKSTWQSTLGRRDFIRLPSPAARMTAQFLLYSIADTSCGFLCICLYYACACP